MWLLSLLRHLCRGCWSTLQDHSRRSSPILAQRQTSDCAGEESICEQRRELAEDGFSLFKCSSIDACNCGAKHVGAFDLEVLHRVRSMQNRSQRPGEAIPRAKTKFVQTMSSGADNSGVFWPTQCRKWLGRLLARTSQTLGSISSAAHTPFEHAIQPPPSLRLCVHPGHLRSSHVHVGLSRQKSSQRLKTTQQR